MNSEDLQLLFGLIRLIKLINGGKVGEDENRSGFWVTPRNWEMERASSIALDWSALKF